LYEIYCGFRVSCALQNAAGSCPQREHMPRLHKVIGKSRRFPHYPNRFSPIPRADSGRYTSRRVNAHLEIRFKAFSILAHHPFNPELLQPSGSCRHTDQSAAMFRHEIDGFWSNKLRGHDQVTFVFSIRIIHDDNHPALLQVSDYRFNGIKPLHFRVQSKPGI
jgi:hypothetical protein